MTIVLIVLFGLMLFGVPVAFAILSSGIVYVVEGGQSLLIMAQRMVSGLNSFTLLAVPLFIFVGNLMDFGGISKRLTDWARSLLGSLPGGLGIVTVVSCAIFAALTGSGPATVAAIGSIMIPAMLADGYTKETSAGMVAAAGALGPIIPPSIPMIIYGVTMSLSIPKMFIAGIVPGLVIAGALILVNIFLAFRNPVILENRHKNKFDLKYSLKCLWRALGALGLPVLILGGIYGGIFTPTESAAVAIVYALIVGFFYGELKVKDSAQDPGQLRQDLRHGEHHHLRRLPVLLGGRQVPYRRRDPGLVHQPGQRQQEHVPADPGADPAGGGLPDGQHRRHPDPGPHLHPHRHPVGLQRAAYRHAVLHRAGGRLRYSSLRLQPVHRRVADRTELQAGGQGHSALPDRRDRPAVPVRLLSRHHHLAA